MTERVSDKQHDGLPRGWSIQRQGDGILVSHEHEGSVLVREKDHSIAGTLLFYLADDFLDPALAPRSAIEPSDEPICWLNKKNSKVSFADNLPGPDWIPLYREPRSPERRSTLEAGDICPECNREVGGPRHKCIPETAPSSSIDAITAKLNDLGNSLTRHVHGHGDSWTMRDARSHLAKLRELLSTPSSATAPTFAELILGEVEMRGEASDDLILSSIKALCEKEIGGAATEPRKDILNQAINAVRDGLFCGNSHDDIIATLQELRDDPENSKWAKVRRADGRGAHG